MKKRGKPIIQVRELWKIYRMGEEEAAALKGVSLDILQGEICCIFGTSGSGKSTLLNLLAGMERPTAGEVRIRGAQVSRMNEEELAVFRQRYMGFIFQSYNLLPSMTAVENTALPLMFRGVPKREREEEAVKMLKRVGLSHRLGHYPGQMSGGQQQRTGIARAFASRPEVIFADEPTGNLDSHTLEEVMALMQKVVREQGRTLVMVTHDDHLAEYADRVFHIIDGKIVKIEENKRKSKREDLKDDTV